MSAPMEAKLTLLEQAKLVARRHKSIPRPPNDAERLELAIAYVKGEITGKQAGIALGLTGNASSLIGNIILSALRHGRARIEVIK